MKNIETKWLQDFLTLAELKNFSHAAAVRNVTQPAFSRRIKSLEAELGLVLIERSKTPIELTLCGKQFKTTALSILQQIDEEVSRLAGSSFDGRHTVRLSAAHSISISLLPKLHSCLLDPQLNTRLSVVANEVDDAVELLIDGKCDFLFSFYEDRLQVAPYRSIYLGRSYLYCVSAVDENGEVLFDLANSDDVPCLDYTPESYMGRALHRANSKLTNNTVCSSSMTDFIKALVLQGKGISWLPDYAIKDELASGQLKILPQREPVALDLYVYRYYSKLHSSCETMWNELSKICPISELTGQSLLDVSQ
ncbi:LysR family transcriptional regulator [Photobacterium gaetbulicola]|uniref:Transcriptional regulator n=1 Tax=Photobacterium gaetbulicola Gung47 TaxID=658445 RepID=A0A0C5WT93_9GAMM|nr:LysR substrate-binding domain-containing protein [Photobacterium gaetbulicola]AJR06225.1 transcriptional regulator [Photobacterium gaetbulicola Gung47]PSU08827.1 LysR family transcriptional regulator [Photobacterium gaetbulicola]